VLGKALRHVLALAALALLQALLLAPILTPAASADRMTVVPVPGLDVLEGSQKAIIAWNGTHEYLLLSVDVELQLAARQQLNEQLSEEEPILVVQLMPFPSVPEVLEADREAFYELEDILYQHLARKSVVSYYVKTYGSRLGPAPRGAPVPEPMVKLIFYEEVGAHHVAVLEVRDARELVGWVVGFFTQKGLDVSEQMEQFSQAEHILADYVERGYRYFTVDVMAVRPYEVASTEPLAYVFECGCVYYPLYISTVAEGHTSVRLFVLAGGWLRRKDVREAGLTLAIEDELEAEEVERISEDIYELLGARGAKLTVLTYDGAIKLLKTDLEAQLGPSLSKAINQAQLTAFSSASVALIALPSIRVRDKPRKADADVVVAFITSLLALFSLLCLSPALMVLVSPPYVYVGSYRTHYMVNYGPWPFYTFMLAAAASLALTLLLSAGDERARLPLAICLFVLFGSMLFVLGAAFMLPSPLDLLATHLMVSTWLTALVAIALVLSYSAPKRPPDLAITGQSS